MQLILNVLLRPPNEDAISSHFEEARVRDGKLVGINVSYLMRHNPGNLILVMSICNELAAHIDISSGNREGIGLLRLINAEMKTDGCRRQLAPAVSGRCGPTLPTPSPAEDIFRLLLGGLRIAQPLLLLAVENIGFVGL